MEVPVDVSGRQVTYLLAERMVRVAKGFRMREVRRLCENGHQTSVVTTRRDLSIETVALRMFSRWQQENFFRYMRHEFALDHLPTTAVEPADPERRVPNPAVKQKQRELGQVTAQLAKAEQAYGQQAHDTAEQQRRTVRGVTISQAELGRTITNLCSAREQLAAELTALPTRVPVRETMNGESIVRLERERKIITDTVKMVAYRAETQLANLVGPLLPSRHDEARKFMRQVFELPADCLGAQLAISVNNCPPPRDPRSRMTSFKRTQRKYVQKAYRVRNWREYETGLRARGSLTVWLGLTDGKLANWNSPRPTRRKPGRQRQYSNHAIETTVTLGLVFGLASRQTEGFLRSLLTLLHLDNDVPDHSTISRRKARLGQGASYERRTVKPVHLLIDSSGLSVHVGQLRTPPKARDYRKLHLAVDEHTSDVVACELTSKRARDASRVASLVGQIERPIASAKADAAYDTGDV